MGSLSHWIPVATLCSWAGLALLLSELRWFSRPALTERLRDHHRSSGAPRLVPLSTAGALREVLTPLATSVGASLARLFGVHEDVAVRLRRIDSPLDASAFRMRQLGWCVLALGLVSIPALAAADSSPLVALLFLLGAPVLAFLVVEQQLASASARWQRRVVLELPVVTEQLGLLLGAGYSLGAALARLGQRGSGAVAVGLTSVSGRVRQGLGETAALREWAELAGVEPLHRLVGVLALNRETGDLSRLISEEARSIRRQVQREQLADMERRSQQVWIPVTVATLVPGSLLLAIPFIDALRQFSSL